MNITLQTYLPGGGMWFQCDDIRPLTYLISATVCGYLGKSASLARYTEQKLRQLWLLLCPLYLLAACNALLHIDTAWVLWARAFAQEQHAYELRRPVQSAILLALFLLAAAGFQSLQRLRSPFTLRALLLAGAFGTLALHLLRYISFHYTDAALNFMWFDHSLSSWIEFLSIALVGAGTVMELLRSQGHV